MKRVFFVVGLVLLSVTLVAAFAGDKKDKPTEITGTLVDVKCYSMGGFVMNDHKDMKGGPLPNCAVACATMGIPVAVLDKDDNLHIIAGPASGYSKWMAMEVSMKGMTGKYADVFIPSELQVKEKGKWVKKDVPGTMM